MPDMKYGDNSARSKLSGVPDYWDRNRAAVFEMHRQVGDLHIERAQDGCEIATRGLLVRHLVLPCRLASTETIVRFLAEEVSTDTYLNIMDQCRPCFRAGEIVEIGRPITSGEYRKAVRLARAAGIWRFDSARQTC